MTWEQVMENRRKWIARLRDPQARQFTGFLSDIDPWWSCCLGHACQILPGLKQEIEVPDIIPNNGKPGIRYGEQEEFMSLPEEAVHSLGMSSPYGDFVPGYFKDFEKEIPLVATLSKEHNCALTYLNDSGVSLSTIADMLESCIDGHRDSPFITKEQWEEDYGTRSR